MSARAIAIIAPPGRENNEALGALLSGLQLEARAADGEAAIRAVAAPDQTSIVLLDIGLLGQDGLAICRRLKASSTFLAPVILLLPARLSHSRKAAALEAGADACLPANAPADAIRAVAGAMLALARQRCEIEQSRQRIQRLEARLHAAQDELEEFASQACHDVEEPLRAITTFAELTAERPEDRLSPDDRAYLGFAVAAGKRFRNLLRSMLSYSRAGRLRPNGPQTVDLRVAASAALQTLRRLAETSGAAIHFEEPLPLVAGDFGELQQVFEQLIANAILYRRPGSPPSIRIGATQADSAEWTIWIDDDGPGVPEDRREMVFQPFKRLHGREVPGVGMGLPIAKKIVEAHGGRIWIESGAGAGLRICFAMPAARRS